MNWEYIAGYGDGEACLLMGIQHEKREIKTKGTLIDGWWIAPSWCVTSYDETTLSAINSFLKENNISIAKFYTYPKIRKRQLKRPSRISVFGWKNVSIFLRQILPYSIAKKEQYELYLKIPDMIKGFPKTKHGRPQWTKGGFIEIMRVIDKINSLKGRKRGKLNTEYFLNLWKIK